MRNLLTLALGLAAAASATGQPPGPIIVGSKKFTESVILGEMLTQLGESAGDRVTHRRELGGTRILWNALLRGDIDIYPEYTGTLTQEILPGQGIHSESELREALEARGVRMSRPLGFSNNYVLAMRGDAAEQLQVRAISDLRNHPNLRFGFGEEFLDRADGWPGLKQRYQLPQKPRGLDHDLAYRAIGSVSSDVIDAYSTDAEIAYYHLRVLRDDLGYFPQYQAVLLYRADLEKRAPGFLAAIRRLEGRISQDQMAAMNARARFEQVPESRVAGRFLAEELGLARPQVKDAGIAARILGRTIEHLRLVGISLAAAIAFALPLGVIAARRPSFGQVILSVAGVIQTIPSLALLVFMIPLLGIGAPSAIVALFLYSLLPIIRNTYTGLRDLPGPVLESADALGLPPAARLWHVELPMAARPILGGIKTSAVINVGTATLGAIIGAGGYGQPILTGIRLDDVGLILQGAIPAAVLALVVQGGFDLLDFVLVPRGLRLPAGATRLSEV